MTKKYIAIIYEGEKTERQLVDNLNKVFFKDISELVPIMFPAGENIYMLWKQLKDDEFETDLIEVIREYNLKQFVQKHYIMERHVLTACSEYLTLIMKLRDLGTINAKEAIEIIKNTEVEQNDSENSAAFANL